MNDSRKDDRLLVGLVTRYREPTMLEPREGSCSDLSPSGMFVGTSQPSPRGALIRFECVSDKAEDGFRGTGRVVWQRPKMDSRGPAGMGVRFVRLEAGGREALERTLERQGKRRPISRTPRANAKAAPSARPREDATPTQPAAIFAAGASAARADSSPPPVPTTEPGTGAVPTPAAAAAEASTGTAAQLGSLRSATLRGIPKQNGETNTAPPPAEAEAHAAAATSSAAPPARPEERAAANRPGLSPLPPAPARGNGNGNGNAGGAAGASAELRDRLGRTRRGVGPSQAGDDAPTAQYARPQDEPDGKGGGNRFATTLRGGTDSDRPAKEAVQQVAAATAEAAAGGSSAIGDGKQRAPQSERPPQPGSVDDLRSHTPSGQNGAPRTLGVTFARTTLQEVVAHGEDWPPHRPRALSADTRVREHDATERRIPIPDELERERYSVPDPDQRRTSVRAFVWLIGGTGIAVSMIVIRLFGGALPGFSDSEPIASETGTPASTPVAGDKKTDGPYALDVITEPIGARITAAGQTVVAPGTLRIDHLEPPLEITAELQGYNKAAMTVQASQFERKGDVYEGRVELTLQPVVKATGTSRNGVPVATTGSTPVSTQAQAAKPREHERATTPPRTPPRRASTTAPRTPRRREEPPAPTPLLEQESDTPHSPVIVVSERPGEGPGADSDNEQTPLAQALDCLARGDNRCVIRALEDKASSARELELLIETYRAVGSTPRAEREMQRYLQRFPDGQRTAEYRRMLERRSSAASAAPPPPE